ncbi:SWIB [Musa troglodytarum]|uniref:SWIB n=1 Tax=Musa troglodytarum TaxID=320322 RepID=A0A9E7KF43_9LILI|nr:SWIB [Musa troglodytarum]
MKNVQLYFLIPFHAGFQRLQEWQSDAIYSPAVETFLYQVPGTAADQAANDLNSCKNVRENDSPAPDGPDSGGSHQHFFSAAVCRVGGMQTQTA